MIYVTLYLEKQVLCIESGTVGGELNVHVAGRREALLQITLWDSKGRGMRRDRRLLRFTQHRSTPHIVQTLYTL